mgnify:CR=1 FL=1
MGRPRRPSRTWPRAGRWPAYTPFMWTKQVASNFGGTRNPLVIQLAQADQGARARSAASSTTSPTSRRPCWRRPGCRSRSRSTASVQKPMEGVSMVYTFDDAQRRGPAHHAVLRDLRQPRHLSATAGSPPPCTRRPGKPRLASLLDQDVWELYDVDEDFSESNERRGSESRQAQGAAGAVHDGSRAKYNVLPIDDRSFERFDPAIAGPPRPHGRTHVADAVRGHDRDRRRTRSST